MLTSPSDAIVVREEGQVLYLHFHRPERKNAISLAMYSALAQLLRQAAEAPEVRVIVLGGSDSCFTAGNDLADFMNEPKIHPEHPVVRFIDALRLCPKPVVALVYGHAIGIGTTLLLHCDLVYVAEDAQLQLPFVNLGLSPEYGASYLLPRLVGQAQAAELLLLGEPFSGAEAAAMGLATMALPSDELQAYVHARVSRLAKQPPAAVRRSKALLRAPTASALEASLQAEYSAFAEGLASAECREAIDAFFAKRPADFSYFH